MSEKCGCRIEMPYSDDHLQNSYPMGSPAIAYCPCHAHAGELREALREVVQDIPRINKKQFYSDLLAKSTPDKADK